MEQSLYYLKEDPASEYILDQKTPTHAYVTCPKSQRRIAVPIDTFNRMFVPKGAPITAPTEGVKKNNNNDEYYDRLLNPTKKVEAETTKPKKIIDQFNEMLRCDHLFVQHRDVEDNTYVEVCLRCKSSYGIYQGIIGAREQDVESYEAMIRKFNEMDKKKLEEAEAEKARIDSLFYPKAPQPTAPKTNVVTLFTKG